MATFASLGTTLGGQRPQQEVDLRRWREGKVNGRKSKDWGYIRSQMKNLKESMFSIRTAFENYV